LECDEKESVDDERDESILEGETPVLIPFLLFSI
jgi:hypothetical protein